MPSSSCQQKQKISPANSSVSIISVTPQPPSRAATTTSLSSSKNQLSFYTNSNNSSKRILKLDDISVPTNSSQQETPNEKITPEEEDMYEEEYVEFDLGGNKSGIMSNNKRNNSTASAAELVRYGKGTSKRSDSSLALSKSVVPIDEHKEITSHEVQQEENDVILSEDEDSDSSADQDWRLMNTELELDMYNEKGELITDSNDVFLQDKATQLEDGSKLGYTRIAAEEQVTKFKKMNEEFEFLFNNKKGPNINNKLHVHKENMVPDNKIYFSIDDNTNHRSKDNLQNEEDEDEEEELSAMSQLNSTKEMLKDSQKIAYVGLVKLIIVDLAISLSKVNVSSTKSVKLNKKISISHLNFQNWSIKMMERIYDHIELNDNERRMIENLSSHGLEPKDLIPSLITVEKLENPLLRSDKQYLKNEGQDDELNDKILEVDIKWTLVCDLFLNLIFDAVYDARSRVLLLKFGEFLGISNLEIYQFERRITDLLEIEESSEQIWNEQEILDYRLKASKKKKIMYVGLATIGGSLVIGLSAGLLAPVIGAGIAAGLSTVGIAGTSGFLAGVGGTSIVTTVGVLSGARIGSKGMLKRVGNVKTFEFRPIHNNKRVNLIITVSGWMNGQEDDVRLPFSTVDPVMGDIYSLLWEPDMLKSTGQTINILATEILTQSIQQILGSTVLIAFMASIQWPMLLSKLGYLLDNPWSVSLDRAWAAGKILADTLIQRNLGVRPVTLVGFSLGARLIYSCLLELNKRGAYGLVQDVILFGSPLVLKLDEIALCRTVVSGHFVNGFSKKDWILGYLFRATSGGLGTVAGLTAIEGVEGIENFDCTEFVSGHMEYRKQIPKLLKELDWEVLNEEFIEIDEPENLERQRELVHEFENVKDDLDKKQKKKGFFSKWFKPQKKEWWEVYDEGRKEVEEKQKQEHEHEGEEEQEEQEQTEELFNVDEIAREVAKIEHIAETDKSVAAPDKTPVMVNEGFKPRSFKTRSVESTPVSNTRRVSDAAPTEFVPRPFKSPKLHTNNNNNIDSNELLKKKSSMLLQNVILADTTQINNNNDEDTKDSSNCFEYDDDDEFTNTGQEIKMSFA